MKNLNKLSTLIILLFLTYNSFSQTGALILRNSINISLTGNINLIVNQPNTNGIVKTGTGNGGIITDNEQSRIVWLANTNIGTYTIPFKTSENEPIPTIINKTTTGTSLSTGKLIVSTYHTLVNNTPYPTNSDIWFSDVTNVNDESGDNSNNVVDRFYLVCFDSYTINPSVNLSFSYDDSGTSNDLGTIPEADLQTQYWNGTSWIRPPVGSVNTATNTVNNINNINYSAPWVLVNKNYPLPIELIDFNGKYINDNKIELYWTTATEINNDYFTIEKSSDLNSWSILTTVKGAGNSNTMLNYSCFDNNPYIGTTNYYRLKQTDYNGKFTYFKPISIDGKANNNFEVNVFPNPCNNVLNINCNVRNVQLINNVGKLLNKYNNINSIDMSNYNSEYILLK